MWGRSPCWASKASKLDTKLCLHLVQYRDPLAVSSSFQVASRLQLAVAHDNLDRIMLY